MTWRAKQSHITGALIVDGSIEADQIKTDSLTANKFKGATQEQYFYKFDDISFGFNTYTTLHEFDMPTTELELVKGRTIEVNWDGYISTGTSSAIGSTIYLYIEVQVPEHIPTFRGIDTAYHESFPATQYQRVYLKGNYLNYFGVGQVGSTDTYREFRNLTFEEFYPLTELVTNGTFSGITGWTGVGGNFGSYFGTSASIAQDSNADRAYFYQEVSVNAGKKYQLQGTYYGVSNANGRLILSTSTDIEDAFFTFSGFSAGSTSNYSRIVDIDVDTVYIIGEANTSTNGAYAVFDNFSLKETEQRTYLDISTSGGQVVPTGGQAQLYHHPFGNAAGGTWKVIKDCRTSLRTIAYYHYFSIDTKAYMGIEYNPFKCRIRARHLFSGDTIYTLDGSVNVKARMTGQQNT